MICTVRLPSVFVLLKAPAQTPLHSDSKDELTAVQINVHHVYHAKACHSYFLVIIKNTFGVLPHVFFL